MDIRFSAKSRMTINEAKNQIAMLGNRVRLSAKLTAHRVPEIGTVLYRAAHRRATPGRIVTTIVLAAMIATPTTLYMVERSKNTRLRAAYDRTTFDLASESAFWRASAGELFEERIRMTDMLLDQGHYIEEGGKVTVKVVATGYSSSVRETDSTPFITAHNTATRTGIMAMSRDLLTRYTPGAPFTFGDRVHVTGLGDFLVEDSMNARWNNRIDLWFPSRLEALRFGVNEVYVSKVLEAEPPPAPKKVSENQGKSSTEGGGL